MNNSDGFPSLPTYQAAVDHYNRVQPYKRGRNKGLRPLGSVRRYDRSQIRMEGGVVICRFYDTDVIKFMPDNSIVLSHGGYESPSTMDCMNWVLRDRWAQAAGWRWMGPMTTTRRKLYLRDIKDSDTVHRFEKTLTILHTDEIVGGAIESKYVLNKQLMAQVRKYYNDSKFLEYLKYFVQMNPRMHKEFLEVEKALPVLQIGNSTYYFAKKTAQRRDDFFFELNRAALIEDEGDRLAAMMPLVEQLAVSAAEYKWDRVADCYFYITDIKKAKEFFYELCRFQYSTVLFTSEQMPHGKVVTDDNIVYMNLGSDWGVPFGTD